MGDDSALRHDNPALAATLWPMAPSRERRRDNPVLVRCLLGFYFHKKCWVSFGSWIICHGSCAQVRSESAPGDLAEKAGSVRARRPGLASRTDKTFGPWGARKPPSAITGAPSASLRPSLAGEHGPPAPQAPTSLSTHFSPPRISIPDSHPALLASGERRGDISSSAQSAPRSPARGILKKRDSLEHNDSLSPSEIGMAFASLSDVRPPPLIERTSSLSHVNSPALFKFRTASLRHEESGWVADPASPSPSPQARPGSYEAVWSDQERTRGRRRGSLDMGQESYLSLKERERKARCKALQAAAPVLEEELTPTTAAKRVQFDLSREDQLTKLKARGTFSLLYQVGMWMSWASENGRPLRCSAFLCLTVPLSLESVLTFFQAPEITVRKGTSDPSPLSRSASSPVADVFSFGILLLEVGTEVWKLDRGVSDTTKIPIEPRQILQSKLLTPERRHGESLEESLTRYAQTVVQVSTKGK